MCWFVCLFFGVFLILFYFLCTFIACLSPLSVLLSSLIIYDFLCFTCFCLRHFTTSLGFSNLPLCPVVINILCDFFCIPDIVKTPEYRNKCELKKNWQNYRFCLPPFCPKKCFCSHNSSHLFEREKITRLVPVKLLLTTWTIAAMTWALVFSLQLSGNWLYLQRKFKDFCTQDKSLLPEK